MKKLIGIVAALAVFFALQACGEGDDPSPGIRLSTETLDFPAGKSTLDLVVSCPQQMAPPGQCRVVLRAGRGCPERAVRGKDL